jgi:hypothetical protein
MLAPTTNSLTNENGIISILPPPSHVVSKYKQTNLAVSKYKQKTNFIQTVPSPPKPPKPVISTFRRQPKHFLPSLLLNTESQKPVKSPPVLGGFVPVIPNWFNPSTTSTKAPRLHRQLISDSHHFKNQQQKQSFDKLILQQQRFLAPNSKQQQQQQQTFVQAPKSKQQQRFLAPISEQQQIDGNNYNVWSQISSKPSWTELQKRPAQRTRRLPKKTFLSNSRLPSVLPKNNNNVTVKHGIYPVRIRRPSIPLRTTWFRI